MAVLINNFMKVAGVTASGDKAEFSDSADISGYAQAAVEAVSAAGIINGFENGSFKPLDTARRADSAMVIYKLMNLIK